MLYHLHRVELDGDRLIGHKGHAGFVRVHDISGVGRVHGRPLRAGDKDSPKMFVVPLFLSGGQVLEDVFAERRFADQAYDDVLALVSRDEGSDTVELPAIEDKPA